MMIESKMMINVSNSTSILKQHIDETEQTNFTFKYDARTAFQKKVSINTKKDTAFQNDALANLEALMLYLAKAYALGEKSDINTKIPTTYLKNFLGGDFLNIFAIGMCEILFKNEYETQGELFHHACVVIFAHLPEDAQKILANHLLKASMHCFGGKKKDGTHTHYWVPTEGLTISDHPFFQLFKDLTQGDTKHFAPNLGNLALEYADREHFNNCLDWLSNTSPEPETTNQTLKDQHELETILNCFGECPNTPENYLIHLLNNANLPVPKAKTLIPNLKETNLEHAFQNKPHFFLNCNILLDRMGHSKMNICLPIMTKLTNLSLAEFSPGYAHIKKSRKNIKSIAFNKSIFNVPNIQEFTQSITSMSVEMFSVFPSFFKNLNTKVVKNGIESESIFRLILKHKHPFLYLLALFFSNPEFTQDKGKIKQFATLLKPFKGLEDTGNLKDQYHTLVTGELYRNLFPDLDVNYIEDAEPTQENFLTSYETLFNDSHYKPGLFEALIKQFQDAHYPSSRIKENTTLAALFQLLKHLDYPTPVLDNSTSIKKSFQDHQSNTQSNFVGHMYGNKQYKMFYNSNNDRENQQFCRNLYRKRYPKIMKQLINIDKFTFQANLLATFLSNETLEAGYNRTDITLRKINVFLTALFILKSDLGPELTQNLLKALYQKAIGMSYNADAAGDKRFEKNSEFMQYFKKFTQTNFSNIPNLTGKTDKFLTAWERMDQSDQGQEHIAKFIKFYNKLFEGVAFNNLDSQKIGGLFNFSTQLFALHFGSSTTSSPEKYKTPLKILKNLSTNLAEFQPAFQLKTSYVSPSFHDSLHYPFDSTWLVSNINSTAFQIRENFSEIESLDCAPSDKKSFFSFTGWN